MADFELRWRKRPGPVTKALGAIGVVALVNSLGDQELDEPDPKVVWHTARSSALRSLAVELASAGRDDPRAVGELARAAGRHVKELRRAAATIRSGGWAEEDLVGCRANRLLVAAATGRPFAPIPEAQLAWFDRVRVLGEVARLPAPLAMAFAELASDEPELSAIEDDIRRIAASPEFAAMDGERRNDAVSDLSYDRLAGIRERTSIPIVRTHAAWCVARDHLFAVAALPIPGTGSAGV